MLKSRAVRVLAPHADLVVVIVENLVAGFAIVVLIGIGFWLGRLGR